MLSQPFSVPNIVVCPLSIGSSGRSRGTSGIIKLEETKDNLVRVYKVGEVLVRCGGENLRGWQIRGPQHHTPYILAHA